MMCLSAFDALCRREREHAGCRLVPLKGIDLVRTLYADSLDREMHDIDLLVVPAQKSREFIGRLLEMGYRPEFAFALEGKALESKKKVSMLAPSENLPHIDVHLALITKRFFAQFIGRFNEDALARLHPVDEVVSELDDVDRWLFLATHLAFHFLTGDKWYRDLALLLDKMDEQQLALLHERAMHYRFDRVVAAVLTQMQAHYPESVQRIPLQQWFPSERTRRFLRYTNYYASDPRKLERKISVARYYWEYLFIATPIATKARALLFPSLGNIQNIYRCHALVAPLMYLPHIILNLLGLLVFSIHYAIVSR